MRYDNLGVVRNALAKLLCSDGHCHKLYGFSDIALALNAATDVDPKLSPRRRIERGRSREHDANSLDPAFAPRARRLFAIGLAFQRGARANIISQDVIFFVEQNGDRSNAIVAKTKDRAIGSDITDIGSDRSGSD